MTSRPLRAAAASLAFAIAFAPRGALAQQGTPLGQFASQRIAVMPVQYARADTGTVAGTPDWAALRHTLDDSIAAAIADRGLGKKWAYAPDVIRMAKRNVAYVSDPMALGVGSMRSGAIKPEDQVPPMALDNLRSLIALADARLALVPVEVFLARRAAEARPILRLVLIDVRGNAIVWYQDLSGPVFPAGTAWTPANIGGLAQQVADLVAPR